jgi:hypothetical protein
MFANVDSGGNLGSNVDAVSATRLAQGQYGVAFTHPIGECAADAQAGVAGGPQAAEPLPSSMHYDPDNPNQWDFEFLNLATNQTVDTPFLLTVTCASSGM